MPNDEITHIGDLRPDPKNARKHTPRNVGTIVDALHEVGAARSIVIDEDNIILAGNATIEAAAQAGIERVRVVDADGDEIIAVRRSGLTGKQKTRLALYDNRAAEHAEWDTDVLGALNEDGTLDGMFYEHEIDRLINGAGEPVDPSELWRGMPEFEYDQRAIKTLYVHFQTADDVAAFSLLIGQKIGENTKSIWFPEAEKQVLADKRYSDES